MLLIGNADRQQMSGERFSCGVVNLRSMGERKDRGENAGRGRGRDHGAPQTRQSASAASTSYLDNVGSCMCLRICKLPEGTCAWRSFLALFWFERLVSKLKMGWLAG
jgi:hypothetical protein